MRLFILTLLLFQSPQAFAAQTPCGDFIVGKSDARGFFVAPEFAAAVFVSLFAPTTFRA